MGLEIRQASVEHDRQEMLELLGRNLSGRQEAGFHWRYTQNPAGTAWSWFLHQSGSSRAIGMASLFPRTMYVDTQTVRAGQVMHFVIDAEYRSLGPAVMLQRATFCPVDSGKLEFCYDCPPHDQGMSTFVRLGMQANCDLVRYALLLRSDEYLAKKAGNSVLTKPAAAIANLFLGRGRIADTPAGLEIEYYEGPFGEEFSALDRAVPSARMVRRQRSAEELNWRYRQNPEREHRVVTVRRGGELLAFAVLIVESEGIASLVELFGRDLSVVGMPLLAAITDLCVSQNLWAVYAHCSKGNPFRTVLEAVGFRPRERAARVVAYTKATGPARIHLHGGLQWSLGQTELLG